MKKPLKTAISISFLFISTMNTSQAQLNLNNWQLGINAGAFIYQGDLAPSLMGSYRTMKPGVQLYVSRVLNPSFLLRTNLAFAALKGNDASYSSPSWRQQRNLSFTTPVTEISELLVWNIFGNNGNEVGKKLSPYAFAGAGMSFLKINRDYSKMDKVFFASDITVQAGLAADIAHKTPGTILVLPVGIGMEYYLKPKLSLTLETALRYTFTDYLDGFSKVAGPAKKDMYHSHTIGLVYKFGGSSNQRLGCPSVL